MIELFALLFIIPISSFGSDQNPSKKLATPKMPQAIVSHPKRIETHTAKAYLDPEKTQLIYTEKHVAIFIGDQLTESTNDYFDLSNKKIAELNSSYTKSLLMPTYIFRDLRTGAEEGLRLTQGEYFIFRKKPGSKEEVHLLKDIDKVFSCQGWHYYLVKNLAQVQKKPLQMKLIFPSKLDYYSFRARALESSNGNQLNLRLEFDSWLIRLFAPHLDISYDITTKKLLSYYGPSNLTDTKGEIQKTYIYYE